MVGFCGIWQFWVFLGLGVGLLSDCCLILIFVCLGGFVGFGFGFVSANLII